MDSLLTLQWEAPEELRPFAVNAASRLSYLHPKWRLRTDGSRFIAEGFLDEAEEIVIRDFLYSLYREKILAETMELRRDLLNLVSRS